MGQNVNNVHLFQIHILCTKNAHHLYGSEDVYKGTHGNMLQTTHGSVKMGSQEEWPLIKYWVTNNVFFHLSENYIIFGVCCTEK